MLFLTSKGTLAKWADPGYGFISFLSSPFKDDVKAHIIFSLSIRLFSSWTFDEVEYWMLANS